MKMGSKQKQNPDQKITFFKVLIGDFTEEMMIPPAFIMEHKKIIVPLPERMTLKSFNLGKSHLVSVVSNGDGFFFFKNGWKEFMKDNDLEVGDFLVFNLVDDATFEVLIYGHSCCLKKIKLADEDEDDDDVVIVDDDDDDDDHKVQNKTVNNNNNNNSSIKVTSTAFCTKGTTFKKRGRGRPPKLSRFKKPQVSAAKAADERPNKTVKGKTELSKKKNSADPYTELVLKEYQEYNVVLPKEFAVRSGLENKRRTMIQDSVGRQWPVLLMRGIDNHVYLSTGWSAFYHANGLTTGDTLALYSNKQDGDLITAEVHREF